VGSSKKIWQYLTEIERLLIVTDKKLYQLGMHQDIVNSIDNRTKVEIYKECSEDPRMEEVEQVVDMYKDNKIDCVLGLGGGSSMDVAKLVAYLLDNHDQSLTDILGINKCRTRRKRLI